MNSADIAQLRERIKESDGDTVFSVAIPTHDLTELLDRLEAAERGQQCLAEAIRDAAMKAGIVRESASLTGPMLMLLCDDLASLAITRGPEDD